MKNLKNYFNSLVNKDLEEYSYTDAFVTAGFIILAAIIFILPIIC